MSPHSVVLLVLDGAPVFELAVPCEVFGRDRSDLADPWYDFSICTPEAGTIRTSADQLRIEGARGLDALTGANTVVVAPCANPTQLRLAEPVRAALAAAHGRGARLVSICSGAFILAEVGLLDGRPATTHWMYAEAFAAAYPRVRFDPRPLYIDDGDVLTSAGTGSGIDLCLHVVRKDFGTRVANEVARRMVVPPHREGGQSQFCRPTTRQTRSVQLGTVLSWAHTNLDRQLSVADLARVANLGERTFARRFRRELGTTPMQWVLEQRMRLAQELLEGSDEPVETVARLAGFGTAANFRHHFVRATTVSPQSYRKVFHAARNGGDQTGTTGR